jgi:hypothetical protein
MCNWKCSLALSAALLLTASIGFADPIVIDFEGLADQEDVTNQFAGLGVVFNNGSVLSKSTGSLNWQNFPPYSGDKVIYDSPNGGQIRVDAVGLPWDLVGGYVTGNRVVTLRAYDAGGTLLGSDALPAANYTNAGTGYSPNIFLSVAAAGIAYATFDDGGNTYTIDDFTFEPVPAPSALVGLLGMAGMGLVIGVRRRFRKA